jgi:hypothetical protein
MGKQVPIVDYLVIDDGEPHLAAWESVDSGAIYFDRRNGDAKSGGTEFKRRSLGNTGARSRLCTAPCREWRPRMCRRSSTSMVAAR